MGSGNARKHECAPTVDRSQKNQAKVVSLHDRSASGRGSMGTDNLLQQGGSSNALPRASEELAAAVRETSVAVNTIIDEAEALLANKTKVGRAYRAAVQKAMLRILEVCAFEDLTGQRIAKVAHMLEELELSNDDKPSNAACSGDASPIAVARLDGPGLNAPHMSQTEVDAAFRK